MRRKRRSKRGGVEEARSDFMAALVHDLRTPLSCIIGFGTTLAERWQHLSDEERAAFLRRIVVNGEELDRRIANLLDYSRLERGQLTLECRPCDLGIAVAAAVDRTRLLLERHLVLVAVPDDMAVLGDEGAIARVVENLLGNAARYAPPSTTIRVIAQQMRTCLVLSVEDAGPGVAPEDGNQIFEPFFRGAAARGTAGAGIGLCGVRQLVSLMGGQVWVEAPEDGGSRFCVSLRPAPAPASRGDEIRRPEPVAFLHSAR